MTLKSKSWLNELIFVLQPFEVATTRLSGEDSPTLSLVLPTLKKISKTLKQMNDEEERKTIQMQKSILADLTNRTQKDMDMYQTSSYLDPRTKELPFLLHQEKMKIQETVLDFMQKQGVVDQIKSQETVREDNDQNIKKP